MVINIDENGHIGESSPMIEDWLEHGMDQWLTDTKVEDIYDILPQDFKNKVALNYVANCLLETIANDNIDKDEMRRYAYEAMKILDAYINTLDSI